MRYSWAMPEYDISSPVNQTVKRLVRLRDRKHRDAEGVFVVEGVQLFSRAVGAGLEPVEFYYDPERANPGTYPGGYTASPGALDRASYRSKSEGLIAVFPQMELSLQSLPLSGNPLVLIAEAIEKPGNLGAMLRTANAVGADGFVVVDSLTDPFNPNAVRSSTGALFSVPLATADLATTIDWIRRAGLELVAADPDAETHIWNANLTGPVALLVGAEAEGLSLNALDAADVKVRIPMQGSVDSLNASVSLALLAYEALRQRSI